MSQRLELRQGSRAARSVRAIELPLIPCHDPIPPDSVATCQVETFPNPDSQIQIRIGAYPKTDHPETWILGQIGPKMMHVFVVQIREQQRDLGLDRHPRIEFIFQFTTDTTGEPGGRIRNHGLIAKPDRADRGAAELRTRC